MVLDMELAIFTLIRSFREGNFELYRYALYETDDPLFLRKEQCQLCTMDSYSLAIHDGP